VEEREKWEEGEGSEERQISARHERGHTGPANQDDDGEGESNTEGGQRFPRLSSEVPSVSLVGDLKQSHSGGTSRRTKRLSTALVGRQSISTTLTSSDGERDRDRERGREGGRERGGRGRPRPREGERSRRQ
jgi:hypothetical protein